MAAQKWMKKTLVILLSILTLGLVTPDDFYWNDDVEAAKPNKKTSVEEVSASEESTVISTITILEDETSEREKVLQYFCEKAEEISYDKFGERIKPRIEDEFNSVILPKIEEVIELYIQDYPEQDLTYLGISQNTTTGVGEKIFHIYNTKNGEDLIRFHVRRENPPQQGYWFNFHYHTNDDQFVAHHDLGSIYWDKNTPPNWSSSKLI